MQYKLVHVTTGGEFKTPLVASQLFDQAEIQKIIHTNNSPKDVEAWIIEPMRLLFDKKTKSKLKELRERTNGLKIIMFNGINRLNDFPIHLLLIIKRILLGRTPVIFHCRGEATLNRLFFLKKIFPKDKFVLDIRGYWPAESLYQKGILDLSLIPEDEIENFNICKSNLDNAIRYADGVCSISSELIKYLKEHHNLQKKNWVVPCCVKRVTFKEEMRKRKRTELSYKEDDIVLVYSGTTAPYQHLEDLCLPVMKKLSEQEKNIKLLFLTPDKAKMEKIIADTNLKDYTILSLKQNEVADYLSAADFGLLLRKPTLVNKVANPVKIAEYLAAGLGIIIQENSVSTGITSENIQLKVNLFNKNNIDFSVTANLKEKLKFKNRLSIRNEALEICQKHYTWENSIKFHRENYLSLLSDNHN